MVPLLLLPLLLERRMQSIYDECKDPDGFLYALYASENFTG